MSERFASATNDQRAALLGVLTNLPPDDWTRSTAWRGWSVHDVVAHLVEGELLFGRIYRGELAVVTGDDADPQAGVNRWARADGETLRFSLWHHGSATQRVIDSRSHESWLREVTFLGRLIPLADVLRTHFFETAVHSRDVAAALDLESLWSARAELAVEYCVTNAPRALAAAGARIEAAVRVVVPSIGSWTLDDRGGPWELGDPQTEPAATWQSDPETLVLAATGRLDTREALARSTVSGDAELLTEVLSRWRV